MTPTSPPRTPDHAGDGRDRECWSEYRTPRLGDVEKRLERGIQRAARVTEIVLHR
jgi:hypothetical protein